MLDVRMSQRIAPAFYALTYDVLGMQHREYMLSGGRGSGKSSWISLMVILLLLYNPDMDAIVLRKVGATLRESVYEQIRWAVEQLGLLPYFTLRKSPLEIEYRYTGQRVLFRGLDDDMKLKSLKPRSKRFGVLWLEELSEFDGMDEILSVQASVLRGEGGRSVTFMSYNPPVSERSWVNREVKQEVPGRIVHRSTYLDLPPDWVGASFLAQAEAIRQLNERRYRHVYLGEVTGSGGQVFDNLEERLIPEDERHTFDRIVNGLDFGFAGDPDALVRVYWQKNTQTLYLLDEFYGKGHTTDRLAEAVRQRCGTELVTCDSEDPRMINELRLRGVNAIAARKGPGSVEHGMRWLQDAARIVIDKQRCPNAAREFACYEYPRDPHKTDVFLAAFPDRDNHTIDAVRYAVERLRLPKLGFV